MADKGVIIEYDFAAMDGAGLLYGMTAGFLSELDGIPFDPAAEAKHFAGGSYQGCFAEYFQAVKTKKTALKAARATEAFDVSTEMGASVILRSASTTGTTRASSTAAGTGVAPGRVDSPPISRISQPSAMREFTHSPVGSI